MKVIYCDTALHDEFKEGESTLEKVNEYWVRISNLPSKEGQDLRYIALVFKNTENNRRLLNQYRHEYLTWKSMEPSPYAILNKMEK